MVDQIIKTSEVPVILDADGINAVAPFIDIVKDKKAPLIITPHPGEMARLIGESVDYVCSHRLEVAKAFAKENDVIIVLKGANTIVTNGVDVYFNTTGNPGMAMGGTGDMLAGIIGSFAAQGIEPIEACKAAVYIHGRCGDIAAQEISTRGISSLPPLRKFSISELLIHIITLSLTCKSSKEIFVTFCVAKSQ